MPELRLPCGLRRGSVSLTEPRRCEPPRRNNSRLENPVAMDYLVGARGAQAMGEQSDSRYTYLGHGCYTLAEVSRFTGLHPNKVRTWFKVRSDLAGKGPVFQSDYSTVGDDFAVSFFDLIDALFAGQFRDKGVSMRTMRKAYSVLKRRLDTAHPFCHHSLYTDGRAIFEHTANDIGDEKLTEVISSQQFFLHVKTKLTKIEYGQTSNLAERWNISTGVVIDPHVAMGKPVIKQSGLTTFVLASQFRANHDDAGLIADLYDVGESDVQNAVEFEKRFGCLRTAA